MRLMSNQVAPPSIERLTWIAQEQSTSGRFEKEGGQTSSDHSHNFMSQSLSPFNADQGEE
jgi:hypothetical protein